MEWHEHRDSGRAGEWIVAKQKESYTGEVRVTSLGSPAGSGRFVVFKPDRLSLRGNKIERGAFDRSLVSRVASMVLVRVNWGAVCS